MVIPSRNEICSLYHSARRRRRRKRKRRKEAIKHKLIVISGLEDIKISADIIGVHLYW